MSRPALRWKASLVLIATSLLVVPYAIRVARVSFAHPPNLIKETSVAVAEEWDAPGHSLDTVAVPYEIRAPRAMYTGVPRYIRVTPGPASSEQGRAADRKLGPTVVRQVYDTIRCAVSAPEYVIVPWGDCTFVVAPRVSGRPKLVVTFTNIPQIKKDRHSSSRTVDSEYPSGDQHVTLDVPVDALPGGSMSTIAAFLGVLTALGALLVRPRSR